MEQLSCIIHTYRIFIASRMDFLFENKLLSGPQKKWYLTKFSIRNCDKILVRHNQPKTTATHHTHVTTKPLGYELHNLLYWGPASILEYDTTRLPPLVNQPAEASGQPVRTAPRGWNRCGISYRAKYTNLPEAWHNPTRPTSHLDFTTETWF